MLDGQFPRTKAELALHQNLFYNFEDVAISLADCPVVGLIVGYHAFSDDENSVMRHSTFKRRSSWRISW